ncbi:hypothetical protein C2R22_16965 [Salinigranum rubrum]|uniref:Uncharacterized protein n=1 Tax=Salinigranum rubrum TaxID=755307 RepID=A0A2I8VMI8_9EURY|nr:hypothetical protein [Salinigranum rubrum]AUV83128.1 hypothetical protein C2R22_16965 [Salinigranum rubrum]
MASSIPIPAGRSLTETLRRVETAVWSLCTVATAVFLVACVVGAFLVASRPVGLPVATSLVSVVVGTLVFVVADVVFE